MSQLWRRIPILPQIFFYWQVFRRHSHNQLFYFIALSLLVTLTEGLGITIFFPLLNQISSSSAISTGPGSAYMDAAIRSFFAFLGVSMTITHLLLAVLGVFLLKAALQTWAGNYQGLVITRFLASVCEGVYRGYSEVEYSYMLKTNVGTLSNILMNETIRSMSALIRFASLFPPLLTISVFTAISLSVDWRMTVFAVAFGMMLLVLFKSLSTLSRRFSYRFTDELNRMSSLIVQSLSGFKYLASTASFAPLRSQVFRAIRNMVQTQYKMAITANVSQTVNEPSIVLFIVSLIWYQAVHRGRPISEVFVMILFFYRLIKEVMAFQLNWNGFSSTMGSLDLVMRTLDETAARKERSGASRKSSIEDGIRFHEVSFGYTEKPVLQKISLVIPRNQTIAIVGESGAGKSTFVDLLTGLLTAKSGEVFVDDTPYAHLDFSVFRSTIGYVTQEGALFDDTVANNISLWSCDSAKPEDLARIRTAAEIANCLEFIEGMPQKFDSVIGERGIMLSGGQKQRLAIAREIFKNPSLLILDEATSALDTRNEREIQKSIDNLKGRTTVVIIAHRLSTIRDADRIFVLSDGRMIEQGTFQELNQLENSQFSRLCRMQGLSLHGA